MCSSTLPLYTEQNTVSHNQANSVWLSVSMSVPYYLLYSMSVTHCLFSSQWLYSSSLLSLLFYRLLSAGFHLQAFLCQLFSASYPFASYYLPAYRLPAFTSKPSSASKPLPAALHQLPSASYYLPAVLWLLFSTSYQQVSSASLPLPSVLSQLPSISYLLPAIVQRLSSDCHSLLAISCVTACDLIQASLCPTSSAAILCQIPMPGVLCQLPMPTVLFLYPLPAVSSAYYPLSASYPLSVVLCQPFSVSYLLPATFWSFLDSELGSGSIESTESRSYQDLLIV
jgi:hypothetical protein